jgi:TusA-related sulfurtransferase
MPQLDGTVPPRADVVMESYGESCGVLEPRLWATMRGMRSGEVLEVRSDRPEAREGVPSWSWLTGNELLAVVREDARRTRFYLRRK